MKKNLLIPAIFIALTGAMACNSQSDRGTHQAKAGTNTKPEQKKQPIMKSKPSEASIKWVNVQDMTENSFSIQMPEGWKNAAFLHRLYSTPRSLVTSVSPDNNTVIYFGDPRIPAYALPNPQLENTYLQVGMRAPFQFTNFVPAETYFSNYLQQRFGSLTGFRIIEKFDNEPLLKIQQRELQKIQMQAKVTNASYRFQYQSNGRTIHGELNGTTLAMGGIWVAEVGGFCTAGDPAKAAAMMVKMVESRVSNPQWQEEQNAKHRQTMAMIDQNTANMTRQHEQNMANIRASGAAHQQRMADMQRSNDEWNSNWSKNQASIDRQHERTVNAIKGEHTVMDREGNTYQVDNSQSKYFVDKQNNTYIGAHSTVTLDDLRKIQDININNFEEVQIIR